MTKQEIIKKLGTKKVSTLMDEDRYWEIVETVLNHPAYRLSMVFWIIDTLVQYPLRDTVEFYLRTQKYMEELNNSDVHYVGSHLNKRNLSDDSFKYFRSWVISQGKEVYYLAKNDPEALLKKYKAEGIYRFEEFGYIGQMCFKRLTRGKEVYDFT